MTAPPRNDAAFCCFGVLPGVAKGADDDLAGLFEDTDLCAIDAARVATTPNKPAESVQRVKRQRILFGTCA